jgi:hypothetical protein
MFGGSRAPFALPAVFILFFASVAAGRWVTSSAASRRAAAAAVVVVARMVRGVARD